MCGVMIIESRRKGDGDLWWRERGCRAWTPDTTPPLKERLPDVPKPPTRGTTERGRSRGRDGGARPM